MVSIDGKNIKGFFFILVNCHFGTISSLALNEFLVSSTLCFNQTKVDFDKHELEICSLKLFQAVFLSNLAFFNRAWRFC